MKKAITEAIKIVEERIKLYDDEEIECIILQDGIIEKDDYWIFYYNSSKFVETADYSYTLVGNAPLIVDKYECGIYDTGTSHDINYYSEQFENTELPQIKLRFNR